MTVQKAIKIIDWWIGQKKQTIQELQNKWLNSDDAYGVEKALLHSEKTIILNLEVIRKELIPNCNHPKKMRDTTADGQVYCMNCNFDL
ncbi:MAG: hypothetical protein K5790_02270 [Nitrosopumilus sp.]|uniref:hypothetical protein n=1 Tax=Nitrosopumilus sp. TaxID=2024843 RepID=UPI00247DF03A|nr:hypothetical protein [Nitrosopumilus sp.]MCV0392100.1 hypothetical protein [Nitrosopumilus sp.]